MKILFAILYKIFTNIDQVAGHTFTYVRVAMYVWYDHFQFHKK